MPELLLGCGHQRVKVLVPPNRPEKWTDLTTLDYEPACKPDVLANLDVLPWPLPSNTFDEVHAYEVMEHLGSQGNAELFFAHFYEIWRILKPDGHFCATVPSRFGPWLWGDPGHRRVILPETLTFLDRSSYAVQVGRTAMSDYRSLWNGDFKILYTNDDKRATHSFVLLAIKPIRE